MICKIKIRNPMMFIKHYICEQYNGEWTFPLFILDLYPAAVKSLDVCKTLHSLKFPCLYYTPTGSNYGA